MTKFNTKMHERLLANQRAETEMLKQALDAMRQGKPFPNNTKHHGATGYGHNQDNNHDHHPNHIGIPHVHKIEPIPPPVMGKENPYNGNYHYDNNNYPVIVQPQIRLDFPYEQQGSHNIMGDTYNQDADCCLRC